MKPRNQWPLWNRVLEHLITTKKLLFWHIHIIHRILQLQKILSQSTPSQAFL